MPAKDAYLETRVMTAAPDELHLMVVDGAIRAATRGEEALGRRDFESAYLALNESREFVCELIAGIKDGIAPDLSEKVKSLFVFVYRTLAEADTQHDASKVRDALKILRMHRETWTQLIEKLAREQAHTPIPDGQPQSRQWLS